MIQFLVMEDNIIKSSDLNKQASDGTKPPKKQSTPKVKKEPTEVTNETYAVAPEGYKFIYYQSGSGYVGKNGMRFDEQNRLQLLPNEEADHLLQFPNFRLPDVLELIEYAKEI